MHIHAHKEVVIERKCYTCLRIGQEKCIRYTWMENDRSVMLTLRKVSVKDGLFMCNMWETKWINYR